MSDMGKVLPEQEISVLRDKLFATARSGAEEGSHTVVMSPTDMNYILRGLCLLQYAFEMKRKKLIDEVPKHPNDQRLPNE